MNKKMYYYIVECSSGINRISTFKRAANHWEAESLAEADFFKEYQASPTDVESRKSTKTECYNLFNV